MLRTKITLLFLFMLRVTSSFSQDCEKIRREVDDMKGIVSYNSPDLKHLKLHKTFKDGQTFFRLHIVIEGNTPEYSAKGVYVKLEDGSILKDENAPISCSYIGGMSGYLIQGILSIDDDNIDKLKSKKIIKVQLNNTSKEIGDRESEKATNYLNCMAKFEK